MSPTVQRLLGIVEAQEAVYQLTLSAEYEYGTADLEITLGGKSVDTIPVDFDPGTVWEDFSRGFAEVGDVPAYVRRELLNGDSLDLVVKLISDKVVHGSTKDMPALGYTGRPHTDRIERYPIASVRVVATREASREPAAKPSGKVIDIPGTELQR